MYEWMNKVMESVTLSMNTQREEVIKNALISIGIDPKQIEEDLRQISPSINRGDWFKNYMTTKGYIVELEIHQPTGLTMGTRETIKIWKLQTEIDLELHVEQTQDVLTVTPKVTRRDMYGGTSESNTKA